MGFGVGTLEAVGGDLLTFKVGQELLGLGQFGSDAGPLGPGEAVETHATGLSTNTRRSARTSGSGKGRSFMP